MLVDVAGSGVVLDVLDVLLVSGTGQRQGVSVVVLVFGLSVVDVLDVLEEVDTAQLSSSMNQ